jgi:hypothetical protein
MLNEMVQGSGMMNGWGMGVVSILLLAGLVLGVAALIKYLLGK